MCLKIEIIKQEMIRDYLIKNGEIVAYKVLRCNRKRTLWRIGKGLKSTYETHTWKPGVNKSNRGTLVLSDLEASDGVVLRGIHVYLDKNDADCRVIDHRCITFRTDFRVVPVTCLREDFVGAGYFDGYESAVFMKVTLKKEDYKQAIKGRI